MQFEKVPGQLLTIINQVHDLEKKLLKMENSRPLARNLNRIRDQFAEMGIKYHNPLGQPYNETRTDCEATISGTTTQNLVISEVIKPIITQEFEGMPHIIQKAVVIVEGN